MFLRLLLALHSPPLGSSPAAGFSRSTATHSRGGAAPTESYFAAVRVDVIADRTGQELRNELLERLNQRGPPSRPVYHLQVQVAVSDQNLGIQRDDSTRIGRVDVAASFWLKELATEKVAHSVRAGASPPMRWCSRASPTGRPRPMRGRGALREISDDIRTQLALYFAKSLMKLDARAARA